MADVVLVGLPGTGKTTTGRALAHALDVTFVDTDDLFEEREGVSVQDFLRTHDEIDFREREVHALNEALVGFGVVATGGGVVATAPGRALLARERTAWLDCGDDVIVRRVGEGDRPLLDGDRVARVARLRDERSAFYREVSQCHVDASRPVDEVVVDLVRFVQGAEVR